ncbi:MAG: GGDEF domain-containing protein [Proteobacteria bacterium]|nr:GGDEF domain-containing protein [Pseudomonadota bacterium]
MRDSEPSAAAVDRALEVLAEWIRHYGREAFDVDEAPADTTRDRCEIWARHLLVGTPAPGRDTAAPRRHEPEWSTLETYLRGHRSRESAFVVQSLGNLRDAVWAFIQGLRRSLTEDQRDDEQARHRLHRLEAAVQGGDAQAIKTEAIDAVSLLSKLMDDRDRRQRAHLAALAGRLESMRAELSAAREQMARDDLTELYNRTAFDEHVQRVADYAALFGRGAYLLMIDVDHFKWVNDTHGHPRGDEVLRQVSRALTRTFLRRDDFVARYGGEEFAVVLREGSLEAASMLAERALYAVREAEVGAGDETLRVTVSIGLAALRPGDGVPEWVERADQALYEAKGAGRDRVAVADD